MSEKVQKKGFLEPTLHNSTIKNKLIQLFMLEITIIKESEDTQSLQTAYYLKRLFEMRKSIKKGKILIICDLKCYGFKEKDIDLLVLGTIDEGSLLMHLKTSDQPDSFQKVYINNFCFTVKEIYSKESDIIINNETVFVNENEKVFDISSFSNSQNNVVRNFIKGTCGIDLFCFSVVLIKSITNSTNIKNINSVLGKNFSLEEIFQLWINLNPRIYKNSDGSTINIYAKKRSEFDLDKIEKAVHLFGHIKKSIGILTKKKLDLLSEQYLKGQKYAEHIGKGPLIIRGPAGSGKTMKMIGIAHDLYKQNNRCLFLTFNQSLVKDLTRLITIADIKSTTPGPCLIINSVHAKLFHLSISFGIYQAYEFIKKREIFNRVRDTIPLIDDFWLKFTKEKNINDIQVVNSFINQLDIKEESKKWIRIFYDCYKSEAIDLNNYDKEELINLYFTRTTDNIFKVSKRSLFLEYYFEIRKNIRDYLNQDYSFIISNSLIYNQDYFNSVFKNTKVCNDKETALVLFNEHIQKIIEKSKIWDYLFVDEGQDWHREELEIIYKLYGFNKIIITDGLQQQIIRENEYLDWEVFEKKRLFSYKQSFTVSLRQKENLCFFQNKFAELTDNSWRVMPANKNSKGRVIVSTIGFSREMYSSLNQIGTENLCDLHDSILFLIPPSFSKKTAEKNYSGINEKNELISKELITSREFKFKDEWVTEWGVDIWDGTIIDHEHLSKGSLPLPKNDQHRLFHYESSRGLEAWTVVCLDMDEFFEIKQHYYEEPKGQQSILSKEVLAARYAANWCLISMSRAIDTLFITINNNNSELAKLLKEVSRDLPNVIEWIE